MASGLAPAQYPASIGGVFGLADVGRVWCAGEAKAHAHWPGGGRWQSALGRTVSVAPATSTAST
jgi:hypothetical protein